jgi:hypothetical protein
MGQYSHMGIDKCFMRLILFLVQMNDEFQQQACASIGV